MAPEKRNVYLDRGVSDESDNDAGYDSEAAEISKAGRSSKRRKVDHVASSDDDEDDIESEREDEKPALASRSATKAPIVNAEDESEDEDEDKHTTDGHTSTKANTVESSLQHTRPSTGDAPTQEKPQKKKGKHKDKKEVPPGVVYLSSLPPYLKPSALRNLLSQRGFSPITRLFLSPASKHKASSKKNSRQLYTEGWIEFASKKTARRCAETLNASSIGGKKGGFYHDDVWNMKYLRGMRWDELMAGVREEKREVEGRRDEERRIIMRETKAFVEGVEEGRRLQGIKRKKERQQKHAGADAAAAAQQDGDGDGDVKRTWRQFDVKGGKGGEKQGKRKAEGQISDDVKQVLAKIF